MLGQCIVKRMNASFLERHQGLKDLFGLIVFIVFVLIGTLVINAFVFRSFNVEGPSMENTLHTGDRLIVDRLPVTWAQLQNKQYVPPRGQVIVFKNPKYVPGLGEEYIVKRVIAYPGERVVLKNGTFTVYNVSHPDGFNPDAAKFSHGEPQQPTDGNVNTVVPKGELFVSGDHRQEGYSSDSRNGLGTIPYYDVVGPVALRIFPFNKIRTF